MRGSGTTLQGHGVDCRGWDRRVSKQLWMGCPTSHSLTPLPPHPTHHIPPHPPSLPPPVRSVCTKDKGNQDAFLAFRGSMDALSDMLSPPGVAGQGAGAGGKDKGKGKDKAPAAKAGKDALESGE